MHEADVPSWQDLELYLRYDRAGRCWCIARHSTAGAMPLSMVLARRPGRAAAVELLRQAGYSTNHRNTDAGKLWTRDPTKG